jgi:acetaldehyde dehydrogenase
MKKIAILGTGNIGTDLLIKLIKLNYKDIVFVGRRVDSEGIKIAKSLGVVTSSDGINFFKSTICDVVFDCTNAYDAIENYTIFKKNNIKVIDLTPAKIGQICVPSINGDVINLTNNVNMITCGGQASLPMIYAVKELVKDIEYIEVVSQIASKSAGMATRINIDNYIDTTKFAIQHFTQVRNCKVILNVNPAEPCVDMQTTVFMKINNINDINFAKVVENIYSKVRTIQKFVPKYELVIPPMINEDDIFVMSIKVKGSGDYLPEYAGNLDIINCAAINLLGRL